MHLFDQFASLELGQAFAVPGDSDSCPAVYIKLVHKELPKQTIVVVMEFECESLLTATKLSLALQERRRVNMASSDDVFQMIHENIWLIHCHTPHCGRLHQCCTERIE